MRELEMEIEKRVFEIFSVKLLIKELFDLKKTFDTFNSTIS